jgi:hypothetical protein
MLSLEQASRKNQTFQNGDMEVAFYRMERAENNGPGIPYTGLSTVKMQLNTNSGEDYTPDALKCCVTGMDAYILDDAAMAPLAIIFAGGIRRTFIPHLYDWTTMLGNQVIAGLGATIHALNQLAIAMNAPFTFDAKANVPDANRFFHTWFQSLHAVRMAVIEGGHRCETAMRLFYGYDVGQPAPLQRKPAFKAISSCSTMVLPVAIRILNPQRQHNLITPTLVTEFQDYSDTIQQQRDQSVRSTYKQLWRVIYDDCLNILMTERFSVFQDMQLADFVTLDFEKDKHMDIFSLFIEELKQAITDRYYSAEPGRTSVRDVTRATFQVQLKKGKLTGRGFNGIKEVSVPSTPHIPFYTTLTHIVHSAFKGLNKQAMLKDRMFYWEGHKSLNGEGTELFVTLCLFTAQFFTTEGRHHLRRYINSDTPDIHEPFLLGLYMAAPVNHVLATHKHKLEAMRAIAKDPIQFRKLYWSTRQHLFNQVLSILTAHGLNPILGPRVQPQCHRFLQWIFEKSKWKEAKSTTPGQAIKGVTQLVLLSWAYRHACINSLLEPFQASKDAILNGKGGFNNIDDKNTYVTKDYGLGYAPSLTQYFNNVLEGVDKIDHPSFREAYVKAQEKLTLPKPPPSDPEKGRGKTSASSDPEYRAPTAVTPQPVQGRVTRSAGGLAVQPAAAETNAQKQTGPVTLTPSPKKRKAPCTDCTRFAKSVKSIADTIDNDSTIDNILLDVQTAIQEDVKGLNDVILFPHAPDV